MITGSSSHARFPNSMAWRECASATWWPRRKWPAIFPQNRVLSSVSGIAARAAAAALDDAGYLHIASRRNARDRQEFINQAGTRMLPVIDSHANFLMLKCPCPANEVFDHMNKHNIFLAPPVPEMNEYIRVSLGTPQLKCCNSGVSGIQCQFTPWPCNPLA